MDIFCDTISGLYLHHPNYTLFHQRMGNLLCGGNVAYDSLGAVQPRSRCRT